MQNYYTSTSVYLVVILMLNHNDLVTIIKAIVFILKTFFISLPFSLNTCSRITPN